MKPTLKSINKYLPRFDYLRRRYWPAGATGLNNGRDHLGDAYADIDENGNVEDITIYRLSGDALKVRHSYADPYKTIVITDQVEMVFDADYSRPDVVRAIQGAIVEHFKALEREEEEEKAMNMSKCRRYGSIKTHLSLSAKAKEFYIGAFPIDIYEYEIDPDDDDGDVAYRYTIQAWGNPETRLMTEAEVNAWLEAEQDALDDEEDEEEDD